VTVSSGAPNPAQSSVVDIRDNDLTHNTFAFLFEAGFPVANATLKGDLDLTMRGNVVAQSCQADAFIAFTRHVTALGVAQLTRPYIRNSTYRITLGGDLPFSNQWYANAAGFGNQLIVDGVVITPGLRMQYDAAKACN
jgi:hypothetical protein